MSCACINGKQRMNNQQVMVNVIFFMVDGFVG